MFHLDNIVKVDIFCKVKIGYSITHWMLLRLSEVLVISEKNKKEVAPVLKITRMVTTGEIDKKSAALQAAVKFDYN